MTKKKKFLVVSVMVLVLAAAAVVNFVLLNDPLTGGDGDTPSSLTFFQQHRNLRQAERAEEMLWYDSIIGMEGEEFVDQRQEAMDNKLKMISVMETELLLETLLKAKGFEDVVVSVGMSSDNINVIIKAEELTREDSAIIYNTVKAETGTDADFVKILASN